MVKKILVTGGLGFIGSALIRKLLQNNDNKILNIDKITYAADSRAKEEFKLCANYQFEQIDICNFDLIAKAFKEFEPDIVFHLAAESHVDNSIKSPNEFLDTNVIGTFNILKSSLNLYKKKMFDNFLLIHISTDEVYGSLEKNDQPFTEDSPYKPNSPYSATKASSDHLVRAWANTYDLPAVITNCSNNYGPYQNKEKLIPKTISNALNGMKIPIYGNGKQIRDWLHVDDHITALIQISNSSKSSNHYNIGGGNQIRNIDLVERICKRMDHLFPSKLGPKFQTHLELIEFVDDRLGHDTRYDIDYSKIQRELSWTPNIEFDSGLLDTIDWYIK